jgi:hypothetical protein
MSDIVWGIMGAIVMTIFGLALVGGIYLMMEYLLLI